MSKMINCKSCSKEIASSAKTCPGCGAKNKKPLYKRTWFIVLVIFIAIGVIGGAAGGDSSTDSGTSDNPKTDVSDSKKEKFEIVGEVTSESDSMATYIEGVIKNNSGKNCTYVQVTYNLYDADGNQIGTALANINNLEKDGTWKFKAMGIDTKGEIASYKLAEITGY